MKSYSAGNNLSVHKGQFLVYDAFFFAVICVWTSLLVMSAKPVSDVSFLQEYAFGQDVLETCCAKGDVSQNCFSLLKKHGIDYCTEKDCGQINFERECAGRLVYLGVRRSDYYQVFSPGNS